MNSFFARRYVITGIYVAVALTLLARLFYLQIVDDRYFLFAQKNVMRSVIKYPARGPILDRNNKTLVENQPVYDIMVTPKEVKAFDTLEFCRLIGIDKEGFDKRFEKARKYSPSLRSLFEGQIPLDMYASLQEKFDYPGFELVARSVRSYPDSIAAQFLGYIGEVNDKDIKRSEGYYHSGDYIGKTGVERQYDSVLRGQRGVEHQLVDSRGIKKGVFANGAYDTVPVSGERLISSLDIRLQKLGEHLMHNKVGSIVAIEPGSGEILCFVSSPTYNPNLMVGRQRGNNIASLYKDPNRPFLVRPIQAYYPPGSSFKPLAALIGLQEGIITPQTTFICRGYYAGTANHKPACTHVHGVTDMILGIEGSCNAYFASVFDRIMNQNGAKNIETTYANWKTEVNKFGFGVKLDIDMPYEQKGFVPTPLFYDNRFGKNHWRSNTIISLSIGQGELNATPLQMANVEATIANRGFYYNPHLIKGIGDQKVIKDEYTKRNYVGIDSGYFDPVIKGMQAVVDRGTGAGSKIPGIIMCGKTGTAQNSNANGKNHSVFVAFAPRDNPKIAIAVIVENSGQGAEWAAPIASIMVEKYLKDSITVEPRGRTAEWYAEQNLLPQSPLRQQIIKKDSTEKAKSDSAKKANVLKTTFNRIRNKTLPVLANTTAKAKHNFVVKKASELKATTNQRKKKQAPVLANIIWKGEDDE